VASAFNRPLKNPGLIGNGKWEMANCQAFSIFHLRFAMQDAFFSTLLGGRSMPR
jgi:hypothetical protein